jgi:peptide-methionine (S)-S-oxide reductase
MSKAPPHRLAKLGFAGLTAALIFTAAGVGLSRQAAEGARSIPPPTLDERKKPEAREAVAVFAGGCFWGVQGVFQHLKGVRNAVSGYAGGNKETARYDMVGIGNTGHAEAVRITYDPKEISYGRLLQVYFSVAHNPTELNRQGPDIGTQYRSAIFPMDD